MKRKPLVIEYEQNTSQWLEFRKNKIGASDASIIMNQNPWVTPANLMMQKWGMWEQEETEKMKRGKELEIDARNLLMTYYSSFIRPVVYQHENYDWMIASIDGVCENGDLFEIKCPNLNCHLQALDGYIPIYYQTQMQHQMEVCGKISMTYISYNPDHDKELICVEIERDDEYIKELIREEEIFYNKMKNFESPLLEDAPWLFREEVVGLI